MPDYQDQAPVVPEDVQVIFRGKRCSGQGSDTVPSFYSKAVTPADAGRDGDVGNGGVGSKVFHDTALALFNVGGADPTNKAALDALAVRIAKDYYGWFKVSLDATYNGVLAPDMSGYYDEMIIDYFIDDCTTRLTPAPYNADPEELMHHDPANSVCTATATPCVLVYGPPAVCSGGKLTLTVYKVCIIDGRLTYSYVRTDTVG